MSNKITNHEELMATYQRLEAAINKSKTTDSIQALITFLDSLLTKNTHLGHCLFYRDGTAGTSYQIQTFSSAEKAKAAEVKRKKKILDLSFRKMALGKTGCASPTPITSRKSVDQQSKKEDTTIETENKSESNPTGNSLRAKPAQPKPAQSSSRDPSELGYRWQGMSSKVENSTNNTLNGPHSKRRKKKRRKNR